MAPCTSRRSRGRAGTRRTPTDLEDTVTWRARQMAKTPITRLLRIGWDTVGRIVQRVVAEPLAERRPRRSRHDRRRRDQLPSRPPPRHPRRDPPRPLQRPPRRTQTPASA
ncbi:MAG: transposase family protein [Solirubrobacteraceae bacterium]